jgi:hypothetical protein
MTEFKACEMSFQEEPGYMVYQFIDGKRIADQFIPKDALKLFCDAIGMEVKIVDRNEVE